MIKWGVFEDFIEQNMYDFGKGKGLERLCFWVVRII